MRSFLILLSYFLCLLNCSAAHPLQKVFDAHGGLDNWAKLKGLEYNYQSTFYDYKISDHQVWDTRKWRLRINSTKDATTGKHYQLGYTGETLWIQPSKGALGALTPDFYYKTPAYFLGIPFVFADQGARFETLGTQSFEGARYEAVKITFTAETGDTPEDYYVIYYHADTGRLKLLYYVATHPELIGETAIKDLPKEAIHYEEWTKVGGLLLSAQASYASWTDTGERGSAIGGWQFTHIIPIDKPIDPELFEAPDTAIIIK